MLSTTEDLKSKGRGSCQENKIQSGRSNMSNKTPIKSDHEIHVVYDVLVPG